MELRRHSIGILSIVLIFQFNLFGQSPPVNWGPLESKTGTLLDVLPIQSGDFYTLRYSGGLLGSYRATLHNQLAFVSQFRIKPVTENGIANVESGAYFAKDLYVFLSDRTNGTMGLYSQP